MINRKLLAGAFLVAIGLSLGFGIGSLRAAGVPQTDPLFYSGTLTEQGQPVSGTRNIRITLWSDVASSLAADQECETTANGTAVESGRFRVSLDPACVTAVQANPELWVEIEVAGTTIGERAKLGAVPYALEAARASNAPVVTDWTNYTPAVTVLGGDPVAGQTTGGAWRRVGDSMEIRLRTNFSAATVPDTVMLWALPSGYQVDEAKLPLGSPLGSGWVYGAAPASIVTLSVYNYLSSTTVRAIAGVAVTQADVGNAGGPFNTTSWGANSGIALAFSVPIVGWTATQ